MTQSGPKYALIYTQLKIDILSGKYPTGSFLPAENELMELYHASRTTVRRAISILAEHQFIKVQQGRGTEVLPIKTHSKPTSFSQYHNATNIHGRFLVEGEKNVSVHAAAIDMVPAGPDVAEAFRLSTGTRVYRLQRIQYVNDQPFAYMLDYLHPRYVPEIQQFNLMITNLHTFLNEQYHIRLSRAEETISATLTGFLEAQLLHMEINSPIFSLRRISHFGEIPVKVSLTTIRADMFQFLVLIPDEDAVSFTDSEA